MGVVWRGVAWWAKSETVSDLARDKPTPLRPVAVDSPGRLFFFICHSFANGHDAYGNKRPHRQWQRQL